jgi:hypothetical protein
MRQLDGREHRRGAEPRADRDRCDGEQRDRAFQTMTRCSRPSRAPVSRSRLNGRLRSASRAAMLAARVQPAMARLVRIATSASCW